MNKMSKYYVSTLTFQSLQIFMVVVLQLRQLLKLYIIDFLLTFEDSYELKLCLYLQNAVSILLDVVLTVV